MNKGIIAIAIVGLLSVGCEKDSDDGGGDTNLSPSELILGTWIGDQQIVMISITGEGAMDTSYTETESFTHFRAQFKNDGTVETDSLGFEVDTSMWQIINDNMLIIGAEDTFNISVLTATNLSLNLTEFGDELPPIVYEYDQTITFTR